MNAPARIDVGAILSRSPRVSTTLSYDPTSVDQVNAITRVVVEARRPDIFAERLAPRVFTGADQGTVMLKSQVTNLDVDDRVGPLGAAVEGGRSLVQAPFRVEDHARVVRDARADAARAPSLVSVAERSATARELIDRQKDIRVFEVLTNPLNYLAANRIVIATNFNWNGGSSVTLGTATGNVLAMRARIKRSGLKVVLAMSQDTLFAIQSATTLMTLDSTPGLQRVIDVERLRVFFGADEVVITTETVTTNVGERPLIPYGTVLLLGVGMQGVGMANMPTAVLPMAGFAHTVVRNLSMPAMNGPDMGPMVRVDNEGYIVTNWSEPGGVSVTDCSKCALPYTTIIVDNTVGVIMTGVVV